MTVKTVNIITGEITERELTTEEIAALAKFTPQSISPKMVGVAFQGVMCSATKTDQDGLVAVLVASQLQGANFQPTRFLFENGSVLTLSKDNLPAFIATWMPFRQSFYLAT